MNEINRLKESTSSFRAIAKNLTLEQEVKLWLHQRGMFENQTEEVFKLIVKDESMKELVGRWNDKKEDYGAAGSALFNMVLFSSRLIALKYIDDNCPQAWFRPMFLSLEEQQELMRKGKGF